MARPGRPLESAPAWYGVLGATASVLICAQAVFAAETGLAVDLTPVVVIFWAVELDLLAGVIMTAVVGYVADALSGAPPGSMMAGHLGAFIALRAVVRRPPVMSPPVIVLLAAWAAVTSVGARALLHAGFGGDALPAASMARGAAVVVAAVPLYALLRRLSEPFRPREEAGLRR